MLRPSLVVMLAVASLISGVGLAAAGGPLVEDSNLGSAASTPIDETPANFDWPLCAEIGAGFGRRIDALTGRVAFHSGQDLAGPLGAPVRAAAKGRIVAADVSGPYGLMVEVDHGAGLRTRYAQLQSVSVKPGDLIDRGQVIAKMGASGRAAGPHLHFEIWINNVVRDPLKYLERDPACSRGR